MNWCGKTRDPEKYTEFSQNPADAEKPSKQETLLYIYPPFLPPPIPQERLYPSIYLPIYFPFLLSSPLIIIIKRDETGSEGGVRTLLVANSAAIKHLRRRYRENESESEEKGGGERGRENIDHRKGQ